MTRRERLENKLEKREEWAAKAASRSESAYNAAYGLTKDIPLGQPNINGRMTGVYNRAGNLMDKCVSEHSKAEYHEQKAEGLSDYLDKTIFDDDPDAIERITERLAGLEHNQEVYKSANKICRNKKLDESAKVNQLQGIGLSFKNAQEVIEQGGFPSFSLTNNNANIRRYRERLDMLKRRKERIDSAEQTENGVLIENVGTCCRITFAEKPERDIIAALKQAGYTWKKYYWFGLAENLPECVKEAAK